MAFCVQRLLLHCPTEGSYAGRIPSYLRGRYIFLFYSDLQETGLGPPPVGRATCFTEPINLNVKPIQKHPSRHTYNYFDQISGKAWSSQGNS